MRKDTEMKYLVLLAFLFSSSGVLHAAPKKASPKPPQVFSITEPCSSSPPCGVGVPLPVWNGKLLGTVYAPRATGFQLAQVTPPAGVTYFAINGVGNLTITAAGAAAINALTANTTYNLAVSATNAGGTGTAVITVNIVIAPPVISTATFNLTLPVAAGQSVGTLTATGAPTSWAITAGSP